MHKWSTNTHNNIKTNAAAETGTLMTTQLPLFTTTNHKTTRSCHDQSYMGKRLLKVVVLGSDTVTQ